MKLKSGAAYEKALIMTKLFEQFGKVRSSNSSKGDDDIIIAFGKEFEEVPLFVGLDMNAGTANLLDEGDPTDDSHY